METEEALIALPGPGPDTPPGVIKPGIHVVIYRQFRIHRCWTLALLRREKQVVQGNRRFEGPVWVSGATYRLSARRKDMA